MGIASVRSAFLAAAQGRLRLDAAMTNLSAEMATTTQIVGNVESSVNDLRTVNALYSNGAPNPTPGSSGPSQG
jgi:hypothetical protein